MCALACLSLKTEASDWSHPNCLGSTL